MRRWWALLMVTVGILAGSVSGAHASTGNPGMLRVLDLPGAYAVLDQPFTEDTVGRRTVDKTRCLETQRLQPNVSHSTYASFVRSLAGDSFVLYEEVRSFTSASTAAAAFRNMARVHAAETSCPTLGLVSGTGQTPTIDLVRVEPVKVARVGDRSFAESTRSADASTVGGVTTAMVLDGPYVVIVGASNADAVAQRNLDAILKSAVTRLPHSTLILPSAPTTSLAP